MYFPDQVAEDLNHVEKIRQMSLARINYCLDPSEQNAEVITGLEAYFIDKMSPVVFRLVDGTNVVIDNEKKFEKLCTSMTEAGIQNARELTMYDFRIKMEYFEDKAEKIKKHANQ